MTFARKIRDYLLFARNIVLSSFNALPYPYKLTFAITSKCNLRCLTCCVWKRKSSGELTFDEIDRFFRLNPFFNWIDLTGGEIFLRNDLLDITKSIRKHLPHLVLLHYPTNGYLTDRIVAVTKEIASLRFNKVVITVSIDGNREVHNRIRNSDRAFDRSIATYRELKKIKNIEVYIGCTLSPFNIDHFESFVGDLREYLPDIGDSDIHLNIYHYSENLYSNERLDFDIEKSISLINEFVSRKGFFLVNPVALLEYVYLKNIGRYLRSRRSPFPCNSGSISCFIDNRGNVFPCTGLDTNLGDLRENDFDLLRILSKERSLAVNKAIRSGRCPHCWTPCEAYQNILSNLFIRRRSHGIN
ncbi:MAG: radical SAM protein [Spirochaetales bacterium]|nr:radical SAM protein [Spirochaetales bacterium]